jgi:anion-transporting  ArsA/GET3 family ATPase
MRNKVLDRLFKAMPAVGEIATLNKLRALETQTESRKSGSPRWSPILVDLDATGHALMFLELRNVLQGLLGGGPMLRLIESTAEMFSDPHRTRLNLVTTPAELPVTETVELYTRLKAAGTVAFGRIFVNRVPSVELPGEDVGAMMGSLRTAAKAVGDAETLADLAFSHAAGRIARGAREQIERLVAAIDLPVVELPDLPATRMGTEELLHLGAIALVRPEAPGGYR